MNTRAAAPWSLAKAVVEKVGEKSVRRCRVVPAICLLVRTSHDAVRGHARWTWLAKHLRRRRWCLHRRSQRIDADRCWMSYVILGHSERRAIDG